MTSIKKHKAPSKARIKQLQKTLGATYPSLSKAQLDELLELDFERVSYSAFKAFHKSPLDYIKYKIDKDPATDAMNLGTMVDLLLLTPAEFTKEFYLFNDDKIIERVLEESIKEVKNVRATKKYKDAKALVMEEVGDRKIIGRDIFDQANNMAQAVKNNGVAKELLALVKRAQIALEYKDEDTGLRFRCKPDADDGQGKSPEPTICVSLKTSYIAEPVKFTGVAASNLYPLQAAIELEAYSRNYLASPQYWFIVVEPVRPFKVSVFKADDIFIEYGQALLKTLSQEFRACLDSLEFYQGYDYRSPMGYYNLEVPYYLQY